MQPNRLPTNFGDPTSVLHTTFSGAYFPGVPKASWNGGALRFGATMQYLLTETDGLLLCGGFQYDSVTVSEKDRSYAYQWKTALELVVLVGDL